jgi:DMSO/TMAO reductase YedYZ molybdopterin-dependent catalytic subunit
MMKEIASRTWGLPGTAAAGALTGLLAAAAALGVARLVAGLTGSAGEPVIAVGSAAIDLTPIPVKDFAIQHFGSHDKTVLLTGIYLVLAIFAMVAGILARRRLAYGLGGLAVFAALGVAAVLTRPVSSPAGAVPTVVGVAAGAVVLLLLVRAAAAPPARRAHGLSATGPIVVPARPAIQSGGRPPAPGVAGRGSAGGGSSSDAGTGGLPDRRRFLLTAAGAAALAVGGAGAGQALLSRFSVSTARSAIRLPGPAVTGPAPPGGAELGVPGISPFTTPNGSFYRVDTALTLPQVSPEQWHLRVHGMVERELNITFDELLKRPLTEADITLACVSNQVGGPYAGNARWLGASLAALLREAGVRRGADQILSTSTDGWTCGTPIETVMDGRNALLAVGMNGQPLPVAHGFPARMMVPGLYGYVSATKWVVDLEITTFAAQRSYWVQRGYSTRAPIKTESRIDVPRPLAQVKAGRTAVAGVAWAPHRGIDAVQVRADDGAWHPARLATVPGIDTWRQWVWEWDAPPGLHTLQVRATDGTQATQPSRRVPIFPNGATGWDTVTVTVT